jgi:hypothetical protein
MGLRRPAMGARGGGDDKGARRSTMSGKERKVASDEDGGSQSW